MVANRTLRAVCCRTAALSSLNHFNIQVQALATLSAALPSTAPPLACGARAGEHRHASESTVGRWLASAAAASAAVIMGIAATAITVGPVVAHDEAPAQTAATEAVDDEQAMLQLRDWLSRQGADVSKVQIKTSQAGAGAGLGVFTSVAASSPRPGSPWWSWLWPRRGACGPREPTRLASFPLSSAITVRTARNDPLLGEQFSYMLDKQLLDERTAVMVYLLIERLRGDKSQYAPWIRCLPTSFDVPIVYTEQELSALRGTALYGATGALARRMRETWSRLEGPLGVVARDLGLRAPTWSDWVWAYCVFWSRGQSLPVPESGSASDALVGHSSGAGDKIPIQILEGLVPGLDFCNHRHTPSPQCWWEVVAPERPKGAATAPAKGTPSAAPRACSSCTPASCPVTSGPSVRLQLHGGAAVRPGEELFISYGDKSNEELLMLYGFALEGNPHDHLMVFCPLPPPAEWDDVMHARVELLQAYGLRPQFFLPHPDEVLAAAAASDGKASASSKKSRAVPGVAAISKSSSSEPAAPPLVLPGDVLDTLEVFVLNLRELAVRTKTLQASMEERRAARAAAAPLAAMSQHSPHLDLSDLRGRYERMSAAELRHYLQAMGLRMATLTTFIKLLELKVVQLEGPEGTGTLEEDQKLLRTLDQEPGAAPAGTEAVLTVQEQQRRRRVRAAMVYRSGQKQLARTWLVRAKGELAGLLALMREMQERQTALERD